MNTLFSRWQTKGRTGLVHSTLLLAMLLGNLPLTVAQAASPSTSIATCEAPATGNIGKVFLPVILSAGSNLVATAQSLPTTPLAIPRQLRYQVGKTYVYAWDLKISSKTVAYDSEGLHDNGTMTTYVRALADVSISEKGVDNVYTGQVVLRNPFVCSTDGTDQSVLDDPDFVKALKTPILFKQATNGVVTGVSLPADAPTQVTNLQKNVISALQMTLQAGTNNYEVEEQGGQGTYKATYKIEEKENNLHITKSYDQSDFSKLITQGAESKTMTMTVSTTTILDGAEGIARSVESNAEIASGIDNEPANASEGAYVGASVWTKIASHSQFTLKEVKATEVQASALPLETYVDSNLGMVLSEQSANRQGIDLTQVNLDNEFTDFESDLENSVHFVRILDLVSADSATLVLDKLKERLQLNSANDLLAKRYIDILAAVGTPYAQDILNGVLGNSAVGAADLAATLSITTQEQAMIDMVLLSSPTITTVNTVQGLSQDVMSPLQETAVSVLGATISNLADEDPTTAQLLTTGLVQSLSTMTETSDIELYLDAVGNTGLPSALSAISTYLSSTTSSTVQSASLQEDGDPNGVIKTAALLALRKIPGQAAENLLVAALNNANEEEATRLQAANALSSRPELSSLAATALQGYLSANLASPGLYRRYWNSSLGDSKLGVEFPGGLTVASPPKYYLYMYAYQRVNGFIWGRNFNIAQGELLSRGQQNGILFGAYLSLANNRIRRAWELNVPCSSSRSGTLWNGSMRILDLSFGVGVDGIGVTIAARVEGSASVDYVLSANICNINNSSASATITPRVSATAAGEGGLAVGLGIRKRVGGGIQGSLVNARLPVTANTSYNGSNFKFCANIRLIVPPLNARIYGFADAGFRPLGFFGPTIWKRILNVTVKNFSTPSIDRAIFDRCF